MTRRPPRSTLFPTRRSSDLRADLPRSGIAACLLCEQLQSALITRDRAAQALLELGVVAALVDAAFDRLADRLGHRHLVGLSDRLQSGRLLIRQAQAKCLHGTVS